MIFLFSSPYTYYAENLFPLIPELKKLGYSVVGSYIDETGIEKDIETHLPSNNSQLLLNKKLKPDAVILTQVWWGIDKQICDLCKRIPLFVIDHAAPLFLYKEKDGKLSHTYRGSLPNVKCFYAYGEATLDVMRGRGCKGNLNPIGSPRIEHLINQDKVIDRNLLLDTSHRMEDLKTLDLARSLNIEMDLREHSRSTKAFRAVAKLTSLKEEEAVCYKQFIFSFPSSSMLALAARKKYIYVLYRNHECKEVRNYFKRFNFPEELSCNKYSDEFIKYNLYREDKPAAYRIAKDIGKYI
jgi:hypothetical protein